MFDISLAQIALLYARALEIYTFVHILNLLKLQINVSQQFIIMSLEMDKANQICYKIRKMPEYINASEYVGP